MEGRSAEAKGQVLKNELSPRLLLVLGAIFLLMGAAIPWYTVVQPDGTELSGKKEILGWLAAAAGITFLVISAVTRPSPGRHYSRVAVALGALVLVAVLPEGILSLFATAFTSGAVRAEVGLGGTVAGALSGIIGGWKRAT